jgi:ketosteroid isomerase-like protein
MNSGQARSTILAAYAARKKADADEMVREFHEDASYRMNFGPPAAPPQLERLSGRKGVRDRFDALLREYDFGDDWTVKHFVHEGDVSVLVWAATVSNTRTGKSLACECCTVFTWKDGKIHSLTEHTDTAAVMAMSAA